MPADLFSEYSNMPLTLTALTNRISRAVNTTPELNGVWVTAELSDVRVNAGHCYMELIEKNQNGQTVAKLRATIWQSLFINIRKQFVAATGKEIVTGMKVMLRGNATHHSIYGLSFNVTAIDPSYTLGDIERIRREILNKLAAKGILDYNKRITFPPLPQRIAVISAEGAAGYGDFINQLKSNSEGFVFYPFLIPAVMQGERVSFSVRQALEFIESTIDLWDCVAIIRGGGATTDLIGFDEYELAEKVALFPLPIIVGIGHERDRTVLDEIAHTRVKTPTAAASFFIEAARNAYDSVIDSVDRITKYISERLSGEKIRLSNLNIALPALVNANLTKAKADIEKEFTRIPVILEGRFNKEKMKLNSYLPLLKSIADNKITLSYRQVNNEADKVKVSVINSLAREMQRVENLSHVLSILNPQNTLKRGYSVVRAQGKAVTDASKIQKGDRLKIQFYSGTIESIADN